MKKVILSEKFDQIDDYWHPRIAGELNGQHVKLAKVKGEFMFHSHPGEDEMFMVIKGVLTIHFRDHSVELRPGEFLIVPKGVEHKPVAAAEVHLMMFEPAGTVNTGDQESDLTVKNLDFI